MATDPLPRIATYLPLIQWGTGTGIDTSNFDDVSGYYLNTPGLVVDGLGRDQIRAYSPPKAPAFDLTLSNHDGRFSPGGILGNFLGRGPAVTLDAFWGPDVLDNAPDVGANDSTYLANGRQTVSLFNGIADDMPQSISRGQRQVQVRALGTFALLVDTKPTTPLYESIRTDQAITIILDAAGWPSDKRSLDTGDTTILYWWLNGQTDCVSALNAIIAAEGAGGCAYEDGDGVFHFEGRQYRTNADRSLTTQYVFYDGPLGNNALANDQFVTANDPNTPANGIANILLHIIPASYQSNPDEVVRSVTATVNVRTATSTMKVWEYGSTLTLTANQVLDIKASSTSPFKSAITPAAATDYTVSAGSLVGVTLLATSGQTVSIRLVAGASGATVLGVTSNGIQLRAVSLPVTSTVPITSTVDTSQASARSRPKDLDISLWPEMAPNQALDLVNSMAIRYERERRQITFQVANIDAAHMQAMLNARVSDKIRFVHRFAGLNETYWIEQIHHEISPGGGFHVTTFGCERTFDIIGGRYNAARYDLDVYGD